MSVGFPLLLLIGFERGRMPGRRTDISTQSTQLDILLIVSVQGVMLIKLKTVVEVVHEHTS
jgi:hypothetical protein